MPKKHHKHHQEQSHTTLVSGDAQTEKSVVKRDLLQTILVNGIFLAVLLVLFFANQHKSFLDNFVGRIFKF